MSWAFSAQGCPLVPKSEFPQAEIKNMIKIKAIVLWDMSDPRTDSGLMSVQSKSSLEFVAKTSIPQYGNERRVHIDHCHQRKTNGNQT